MSDLADLVWLLSQHYYVPGSRARCECGVPLDASDLVTSHCEHIAEVVTHATAGG